MVPYVRKSFWKHYKDGLKYVCNLEYVWEKEFPSYYQEKPEDCSIDINAGIADQWIKAYNYAMDMTKREIHQAVEGMYHNLK